MSAKLALQKYQILLLELYGANKNWESVHISTVHRFWSGEGPLEYQRLRNKREREQFYRRLDYLKRKHYIERVKEGERHLYKLTAKGRYAMLRLRLLLQIESARKGRWDGKVRLAMYDVPEEKQKYRNFFRHLLKQASFRMLQRSIWVSKYNPRPAIDELLKYLNLDRYFELLEVDCRACSRRFQRRLGI